MIYAICYMHGGMNTVISTTHSPDFFAPFQMMCYSRGAAAWDALWVRVTRFRRIRHARTTFTDILVTWFGYRSPATICRSCSRRYTTTIRWDGWVESSFAERLCLRRKAFNRTDVAGRGWGCTERKCVFSWVRSCVARRYIGVIKSLNLSGFRFLLLDVLNNYTFMFVPS